MVTIVQKEDPVLRQIAKPVPASMFGTPELRKILSDMSKAMATQDDGVAIAAPQIGVSLRIFLVSGHALEMIYPELGDGLAEGVQVPDMAFINPVITKVSREKEEMEEGCLSVRYLYGKTIRSKKARVRAYDEEGNAFEFGGTGLVAQIFQHETDHLDGVLFIDNATDVHDMPPEKAGQGEMAPAETP
jgi:peptide deformylase